MPVSRAAAHLYGLCTLCARCGACAPTLFADGPHHVTSIGGSTMKPGRSLLLTIAAMTFLAPTSVRAEGRSVVVLVEGQPNGEKVSSRIEAHLMAGHTVADPAALRAALASSSRKLQLLPRLQTAAVKAHIDVVIYVQARKARRGTNVRVLVVDPSANDALVDRDIALAAGVTPLDEANAVWEAVRSALPAASEPPPPSADTPAPPAVSPEVPAAAAPPAAPAEPAAPSPAVSEADVAPRAPASPKPYASRASTPLAIGVAFGAGSRDFSYVQRITTSLRPYSLGLAPVLRGNVEFYPAASTHIPVLSGLGIAADGAVSIGGNFEDANGTRVGTAWHWFDVGLRERISLARVLLLNVGAGFGLIHFSFTEDSPITSGPAELPNVEYEFVQAGGDVRWMPGRFSLFGGASGLYVLQTGFVGTLFPHESIGGMRAALARPTC